METKEKVRHAWVRWAVAAGIPAIALAVFYLFAGYRGFANAAVKYVSRPAKDLLGTVFSIVPFSVMELEYIIAGVFVIWFLVRTVLLVIKSDAKWRTLARRAAVLVLVAAYLFTAYLWLLGIDYRSDSFEDKSGMDAGAVTTEDLYAVARYFILRAAETAGGVTRDPEGHFAEDMDGYFAGSKTIYGYLEEEFSFLTARSRTPKKMLLFSKISSYMGFTGVYFPFSGESSINIDAPGCLIPFTIAHELAHQRGVYAEQEANFVGIAACLSSGDPVYIYSGYLSGAIYLTNALYKADPDRWYGLREAITGGMAVDWNDNNAYWRGFETKVTEVSEAVYDGYLRAYGQELGMRSYGACVDLLVAYYIDAARAVG